MKTKNKRDYILKMKRRKGTKDTPKELKDYHKSYKVRTINESIIPDQPVPYKKKIRPKRILKLVRKPAGEGKNDS